MRAKTHATHLPPFSDPRGSVYSLPMKPPFSFEGMTARVFPLRANLASLQRFCNNYLNFIPPEAGRFRAVVPYVYYIMLDYGRMAIDIANIGWFSQREFLFCVPIQWYRVINGQWCFHDWAIVTPFIYVNDDISMQIGRTVYGWPKSIASLTPTVNAWMSNPLARENQATVSTMVFPELYEGKPFEWQVFVEVDRDAPMSNLSIPPSSESPILPWIVASKVANAMSGFGRDIVSTLAGLGIMPLNQGSTPANAMAILRNMMRSMLPYQPTGGRTLPSSLLPVDLTANTLNLKQFRQNSNPNTYCFQALTNGPMRLSAFNRAGLLGESRILLGDVSGGYSIKLHQWPSLPIAQTLGLEVANHWDGSGAPVVELKPIFPFWYDVNMEYLTGYDLCWRADDHIWRDRAGTAFKQPLRDREEAAEDKLINTTVISALDAVESALFNSTLGGAVDAVSGPFQFSEMTMRVLPLLAEKEKLRAFLHNYLNTPLQDADLHFSLWAASDEEAPSHAHVYLTASNFEDVTSTTNNVGDWAKYELTFLIPVIKEEKVDGKWQTTGVGLFPAFSYVDNIMAAVARSEVLGIPTNMAEFEQPGNSWMCTGGAFAGAEQMLLRVKSQVLPAVAVGTKTSMETIVEISKRDPLGGLAKDEWRVVADRWSAILRAEQKRKKDTKLAYGQQMTEACRLGLSLLQNEFPFAIYTLKQFRDVTDPDKACYQSIACIPRTIKDVLDLREVEEPLTLVVHEFPTQPIVSLLGLVGFTAASDSSGIAYAMQPLRPFVIRMTMQEGLGEYLLARSGTTHWKQPNVPPPASEPKVTLPLPTISSTRAILEVGDPSRIERGVGDPRKPEQQHETAQALMPTEISNMIKCIDPQMVIDTFLSREISNWSANARWLQGQRLLNEQFHATSALIVLDPKDLGQMENAFYNQVLAPMWNRPGAPSFENAIGTLKKLPQFATAVAQTEISWNKLSSWGLSGSSASAPISGGSNPQPNADDVVEQITNFFNGVQAICGFQVADDHPDINKADTAARLSEICAKVYDPITKLAGTGKANDAVALAWNFREDFQIAFSLAESRGLLELDAIFRHLARAWQKPDFCVRRDTFLPDTDQLLPLAESWDENWYYGQEPELTMSQIMIAMDPGIKTGTTDENRS
ncbi:MAG: hypothetical protein ACTS6J_04750 [Burkholderiales bacterium]